MLRKDPFHGFRFRIEFDQVQQGGFARVKGLARETKVDTYREGGLNDHEHKFASLTTYGNLILERGLMDPYLWNWHEAVVEGRIKRRNLSLSLHDQMGNEVWRWLIEGAFPVKWSVSDFDASSGAVAMESVELAHHGVKRG